ncbi:DNA cytosine methyltransferase [Chryseobacterium sp. SSA4.19]|uniref:DNA cytosine methyltransferase n=1 Tax=Chryseobacterium sp. SSA4.19 TaxID=2919915 RepID=UPI001F4E1C2B|nr:DNA cytosine methyltransferase [Chryseobacterium sp. SSA4.19]MCJ8154118.1 DNA cytosine methyltransferase [Chryseobacterium sp. SSA4.19]
MLEFYHKYHLKNFKKKSEKLLDEILKIFQEEDIYLEETDTLEISSKYKEFLEPELFTKLNELYFTLRKNEAKKHPLLRKYLPELKRQPKSELLFADFFSGAGGLSQGLINAGFSPAFVNDNYLDALETYYFNHDLTLDRFFYGDISELVNNIDEYVHFFKNVKIIAGGPPCQGFSTANRQNFEIDSESQEKRFIEDKRNILYKQFVKLLGFIKPEFFIMENVRGMRKVENQIEEDIKDVMDEDYFFNPLVLDAQYFGVPQSRKRYILIGGKNFLSTEQIKTGVLKNMEKENKYKLQDALFGLPKIETNPIKLSSDYESEKNGYNVRKISLEQNEFLRDINNNKEIEYLWNHRSRYNNENDLEIFRRLPEGGNSLDDSIQDILVYKNRKHIFRDKYFKLIRNEVSKTITSHMQYDCHMYIHPEQCRGISPREAARIQTFPDDYIFRGSLNSWYKQIGNAVPVKLAEVIAKEIKHYI